MNSLKKLLRKNRQTAKILNIYFLYRFNLKPSGWLESRFRNESIDENKQAIPWFSYPCIAFIKDRMAIDKKLRVYEYGMGNSTKWFATRAEEVVSVDHDPNYFNYIQPIILSISNVRAYLEENIEDGYIKHLEKEQKPFDVIVIDGRNRNACSSVAINALSKRGVIIWDNSNRKEYNKGMKLISDAGFRSITFTGHAPISFENTATTIFYRDNNCLDI